MDGRKTDQVALVLTNTLKTANGLFSPADEDGAGEYEHITVAQPFDSAKYALIRYLQEGLPLGPEDADAEGYLADPVDAIVVAADLLISLTKGKAYGSRRIVFLSDFIREGRHSETGMPEILDQLRSASISLDLIQVTNSDTMDGAEAEDIAFLRSHLVDPLEGGIFGIDEALGM